MSSDSEDDCYGNIAQKLQSIKSKYKEDKINTSNLLTASQSTSKAGEVIEIVKPSSRSRRKNEEVIKADSDVEEISLDAIIAENSKRVTRRSKRNAVISADNILPTRSRKRVKPAYNTNDSVNESVVCIDSPNQSLNVESPTMNTTCRGRGRGRGRGRKSKSNTRSSTDNNNTAILSSVPQDSTVNVSETRVQRGRRQRDNTRSRRSNPILSMIAEIFNRQTNYVTQDSEYPTISVGNTHEYPDSCYNQPLFTSQSKDNEDVIVVPENEPENELLDENEELSVKVYWQNCEYVKFTIRRFQKLKTIFDYFAEKENVSHDQLLFTYNDKILKSDDTPDSITYSIVKFIDGGIVNQSVSTIIKKSRTIHTIHTKKDGIKLKFQCQNIKKPFETYIKPNDKMVVAMMMCAEHFEMSLDKLKFEFDGDLISSKSTARELDLEGGECIDVKISS